MASLTEALGDYNPFEGDEESTISDEVETETQEQEEESEEVEAEEEVENEETEEEDAVSQEDVEEEQPEEEKELQEDEEVEVTPEMIVDFLVNNPEAAEEAKMGWVPERINKLTKQKKEAEERAEIAEARAQQQGVNYQHPLVGAKDKDDFRTQLKKFTDMEQAIESALDNIKVEKKYNEDTGEDEEVRYYEEGNARYAEADLKNKLREVRNTVRSAPDIEAFIDRKENAAKELSSNADFDFLKDEEDPKTVKYKEMLKDPKYALYEPYFPELKQLLAYAAKGMQKPATKVKLKKKVAAKKSEPRKVVPSSSSKGLKTPSKQSKGPSIKVKKLNERAMKSGSEDDFRNLVSAMLTE